jgi:hypothetical protein
VHVGQSHGRRQRRNELQDVGKRVYEYTWEHVTEREDWVIETLRQHLGLGPNA